MRYSEGDFTSDCQLLLEVRQGNKNAFNKLYKKHWKQAYLNAFRRLNDPDQAQDIVQDIFVNIWIKQESPIDNFPAYLNVAVRNRVFKLLEKQKLSIPFFDVLEEIPTMYLQPDAPIQWKEFFKAYEALIETLPFKRQTIFRLRFHEELTTKAIASQLGISRKTVQNQLGKAIEQLRISLLHLLFLLICFYCQVAITQSLAILPDL